jgi:UDP-N-acetylmuramate dehydrogenase
MNPLDIHENVPLAPFTTLGIGGPARHYLRATTLEDVESGEGWARSWDLPLLVLGGGSNVVVSDDGFPGLVLHVDVHGIDVHQGADGAVEIDAAAGEDWDALVALTVERGWAGLECLSGIPGRVGATPIQNVGAYGQEVSETISDVRVIDRAERRLRSLSNAECGFSYRGSRFKREDRDRFVVLGVRLRLHPAAAASPRYPDLVAELKARGSAWPPGLAEVRESVLAVRRRKSMVLDPADPNARSVGSFFLNPIVSAETVEALRGRLLAAGREDEAARLPAYPAGDGRCKLSAAWLIERAGFAKGRRRGHAGLSSNHCLSLVNCGGSTAREIVELAAEVQAGVQERFGVRLEPEPALVGLSLDGAASA